jgi:hypothetical protein
MRRPLGTPASSRLLVPELQPALRKKKERSAPFCQYAMLNVSGLSSLLYGSTSGYACRSSSLALKASNLLCVISQRDTVG